MELNNAHDEQGREVILLVDEDRPLGSVASAFAKTNAEPISAAAKAAADLAAKMTTNDIDPSAVENPTCIFVDGKPSLSKRSNDFSFVTPSPTTQVAAASAASMRTGTNSDSDSSDSISPSHIARYTMKHAAKKYRSPIANAVESAAKNLVDLTNDDESDLDQKQASVSRKRKASLDPEDFEQAFVARKRKPSLDPEDSDSDRIRRRQNRAFVGQKKEASLDAEDSDLESDSSSDDGYIDMSRKPKGKRLKFIKTKVKALPKLSKSEKQRVLDSIKEPADRALQRLMWHVGFRYTLKPHQYIAVRSVSGVLPEFPLSPDGTEFPSAHASLEACPLHVVKTKGLLLADEMGLGKTVQSIGAMVLRRKWHEVHRKKCLPTLVIGPNDAVLKQWEDTLVLSGVKPARITRFKPRSPTKLEGNIFVLMTRYSLQTEIKYLLDLVDMRNRKTPTSALFPNAKKTFLHKLKNQYQASIGKAANNFRMRWESDADCVARLFADYRKRTEGKIAPAFRTVVIDEVHFLKNTCAYWGLGAALLGINSERIACLSGTPYNNGPQDMAAIMVFIDPNHPASKKKWWDEATKARTGREVARNVHGWRNDYMLLRRKELVLKQLPPKIVKAIQVSPYPIELYLYEYYEDQLLRVLDQFSELLDDGSPEAQQKKREMFENMMALMSNMRKVLIHPMLCCGREVSMAFSPSRKHLLPSQERPKRCVCCTALKPRDKDDEEENGKTPARRRRKRKVRLDVDLDDDELDDEEDELCDEEDGELGELVPLDCIVCDASDGPVRHFAHEQCVNVLVTDGLRCPSCLVLNSRVHLVRETINVDESGESKGDDTTAPVSHPSYCKEVQVSPTIPSGFKASAKIESVIQWYRSVPRNDKAIILSFFKGGLDLLEGILTSELGVDVARFDGDFIPEVRNRELARFKESDSCRVLLATVQSGGTGLNIVEANHVCFLDRWFNPCVHEQAQDRCHRINQTKTVLCGFFDVGMTIDQVMAFINKIKTTNASVLLADGTELGSRAAGLSYRDMSGMVGMLIRELRVARLTVSKENFKMPLAPVAESFFAEALDKKERLVKAARAELKKSSKSSSEEGSTQERSPEEVDSSEDSSGDSDDEMDSSKGRSSGEDGVPNENQIQNRKPFRTSPTTVIDLCASDGSDSADDESLFGEAGPTFSTVKAESEQVGSPKEEDGSEIDSLLGDAHV